MVLCAYCKKPKQDGENFSLHRFPSDEKLRNQWIENMGRTNWIPKKIDSLCSRHFDKESIDFRDYRARLRKGSVPVYFGDKKENSSVVEQHAEVHHVEKKRKLDNCENASAMESSGLVQQESSFNPLNSVKTSVCRIVNTTSDSSTAATIARATSSTTTSSPRRSTAGSMIKSPAEVIQQSMRGVNNDHTYALGLESAVRKLDVAIDRIANLVRERKNMNQQQARQLKKIIKLKQITDEMRYSHRKLLKGVSSMVAQQMRYPISIEISGSPARVNWRSGQRAKRRGRQAAEEKRLGPRPAAVQDVAGIVTVCTLIAD